MGSVTVIGRAEGSVRPDRAAFQLVLTKLHTTVAAALADVAERSNRLDALLAGHGLTTAEWTTGGVTVNEEWEWRNERNELAGHRAASCTLVRTAEPVRLGAIITDAVGDLGAQVQGLGWRVDQENPARLALCERAAQDARRRAEAYVRGLGLRLGTVEAISEMPIGPEPTPYPGAALLQMAKTGGGPEIDVNPGEVEIATVVHIRFHVLAD